MFKIEYLTQGGLRQTETLSGDIAAIRLELERKGCTILSVSKAKTRRYKNESLLAFLNTLGDFVDSGVSVLKALEHMRHSNNLEIKELSARLVRDVTSGMPFGVAFEGLSVFPETVVSIVRSGEESGKLSESIQTSMQYMTEMGQLSRETVRKLLYPGFMLLMSCASLMSMAFGVIPKMKNSDLVQMAMSDEKGIKIMNWVELGAKGYALSFTAMVGCLILAGMFVKKRPEILLKLPLPLLNKIVMDRLYYASFFNLYQLLSSGTRLDVSLGIVKRASSSSTIRREFEQAHMAVIQGGTFASGFKRLEPEERSLLESAMSVEAIERIIRSIFRRYEKAYIRGVGRLAPILNTIAIVTVLTSVLAIIIAIFGIEGMVMSKMMKNV